MASHCSPEAPQYLFLRLFITASCWRGVASGWCGTRRFLGVPREGGAIGVWISGVVYGLAYAVSRGFEPLLLLASLLGALTALLLVDWARYGSGWRRIVAIIAPTVLLGFVAVSRLPWGVGLLVFEAALLVVSLRFPGLWRIIAGGGLLGGVGGFVALASPESNAMDSLLPGYYLLMATGFSGLRAVGVRLESVAGFAVGLLLVSSAVLHYLFTGSPLVALVLAADIASRIGGWLAGVYQEMRLRTYGFLEAFRTLAVMLAAALLS